MERQITKDGVIVIDDEEIDGEELVSIMRSRDTYAGWKRDGDKRIAELEAALREIASPHRITTLENCSIDYEGIAREFSRRQQIAARAIGQPLCSDFANQQ